jgi:hypothetical protein
MFLVYNERTKLTASWLNAMAAPLIAAGAFAAPVAWLYRLSALRIGPGVLSALAFACLAAGIGLQIVGLTILGRLRE